MVTIAPTLIDALDTLASRAGPARHEVRAVVDSLRRGDHPHALEQLPTVFARVRELAPIDLATTAPPLPPMSTPADLPGALAVLQLMLEQTATESTIESTLVRDQSRRTVSDTQLSVRVPAEPLVFGERGAVAAPSVPLDARSPDETLDDTFVRAPAALEAEAAKAEPTAKQPARTALIPGLLVAGALLTLGALIWKITRPEPTASARATLDATYASWGDPLPPESCRAPADFERLAATTTPDGYGPDERLSAEGAYLKARSRWNATQVRDAALDRALQCPRFAAAHNFAGRVAFAMNDVAGAETEYRAALDAEPRFANAHYNLALVLLVRGAAADAMTEADRALALNNRFADAWFARGLAARALKDAETAHANFCHAAELGSAPGQAECHR